MTAPARPARLSPRAQTDLDEIWDYSAAEWGTEQAEVYLRQNQTVVGRLAEAPQLGRSCDDVRAGYRKYPVGSHLLFYRHVDQTIYIVRILHQRTDPERHL